MSVIADLRRRASARGVTFRSSVARERRIRVWVGAALALVLAISLFSRFSLHDKLQRDEAIYAYAGQQQAEGVPPYVSIFDPKPPVASLASGAAVAVGRAGGWGDLHAIRMLFFAFACLAVLALYLLATWLFASPVVGVVAAVTFASFEGFALDALTGPNAKTAAVCLAIASLALLVRGRHFWAALAGSTAFLAWQPFGIYAAFAVAAAWLAAEREERWKRALVAAAGAAIPLLLVAAYFGAVGALRELVEATLVFPLEGVERADASLRERIGRIGRRVGYAYPDTKPLLWIGLVLLVALLVGHVRSAADGTRRVVSSPSVLVAASFFPIAAFLLADFQGYPDVYPLLPYAALGIGGGAKIVLARIGDVLGSAVAGGVAAVFVLGLVAIAWSSMSAHPAPVDGLLRQCGRAAKIERLLRDDEKVYAIGNPMPLVLMQRRSPIRYVFVASGVDRWAVEREFGGFDGWTARIRAEDPTIVIVSGQWQGSIARLMRAWLEAKYVKMRIGDFSVFAKPVVRRRAERRASTGASASAERGERHLLSVGPRRAAAARAHGDSALECLDS